MKKSFFIILIVVLAAVLRIYNLQENPPSLYWDEASLGYNAYSILKSGIDEHGESYPLARFIAFGDYKPPGYIYATVPAIAIFGLNEFSVRFPSVVAGVLMALFTYFLSREMFRKEKLSLFASLFIAVSPWSLHLSRGAFEANLAALFNLLGLLFFLKGRVRGIYVVFSALFFLAAFYTFNSNRIISPLFYAVLYLIFIKAGIKHIKWHLISLFLTILFLLPSFTFLMSPESRLRFQEVSIFTNPAPVVVSNLRTKLDGDAWVSKLIHNRRILYISDYLNHFADNFSGRFLFTHGDVNPRLHVGGLGQLYIFDLLLVPVGLFAFIYGFRWQSFVIFSWMLISVIPAAVARETPHALRIVSILPSYQILSALGLTILMRLLKAGGFFGKKILFCTLFSVFFILGVSYYLHLYHIHFPVRQSGEYQYGTKEMVEFVNTQMPYYEKIFVTPEMGRPYIFFSVYTPISPGSFQLQKVASKDIYGFWDITSLGKIEFSLSAASGYPGSALIVTKDRNLPGNYRLIKTIYNLEGAPLFYIGGKK